MNTFGLNRSLYSFGLKAPGLVTAGADLIWKLCRTASFRVTHNATVQFMATKASQAAWSVVNTAVASFGTTKAVTVPYKATIQAKAMFSTKRSDRATIPRCD